MSQWFNRGFITVVLVFPLLIFSSKVTSSNFTFEWYWLKVLGQTLHQSFWSSLLSLVFGSMAAIHLLSLRSTWSRRLYAAFAVLPAFVPQIIVLSSVLEWADLLKVEISGLVGVIFVHVLINTGICAIALKEIVQKKLGNIPAAAYVMGANRWLYYRKVIFPLLYPEAQYLFIMVFAFCMTSFSIPLVIGSSQMSLEVFIYEQMKIYSHWSQVLTLSLLQMVFLFLLFLGLQRRSFVGNAPGTPVPQLGFRGFASILVFCFVFSCAGIFKDCVSAFGIWASHHPDFTNEFLLSLKGTLRIALLTALFVFSLLSAIAFDLPSQFFQKFLSGYLSPSPVVIGVGLWMFLDNSFWNIEFKIAIGLSLVFLPALYRWKAASLLQGLRSQVIAARLMGASSFQIFRTVVFPQTVSVHLWLAGVAAFWACGDFAMTSLLGFGHHSLGMLGESLLASYQFQLASLLALIILAVGSVYFLALGALGRVLDSKPLP